MRSILTDYLGESQFYVYYEYTMFSSATALSMHANSYTVNYFGSSYWKGANGKWYSTSWGGNQYAGARSSVMSAGKTLKVLSRGFFLFSASLSGYEEFFVNFQNNNIGAGVNNLADIGMSALSFTNPIGLTISGFYFRIDNVVGWDNALRYMQRLNNGRIENAEKIKIYYEHEV